MKPKSTALLFRAARAVCCATVLAGAASAQSPTSPSSTSVATEAIDGWMFSVTPYIWVATVDLETSFPDRPGRPPSEGNKFETNLAAAAMLTAQARYGSLGLWADFVYVGTDSDAL